MKPINRILISRMKFIGDVILTTPLIHAVRARYPEAYLAYLGDSEAVSLLEHNPHLNEIVPFDFSRPTISEQTSVIRRIRKGRYDVFIDLFCNPRSAIIAFASGASMRIGMDVRGRGMLYTHRIRDDGKRKTAIDFHYQYAAPIDVKPTHRRTEIYLADDERTAGRQFLRDAGVPDGALIVGLHPGATWPAKIWPVEKFIGLAQRCAAEPGVKVIVTQGPRDTSLLKSIRESLGNNIIILPEMRLRKLAGVISQFSVYVTNDCGPMHISAAVGTPTIGIFGPGEDDIWFPYLPPSYPVDAGHLALRHDVPCHPCHLDYCNRTGKEYMECMTGLSEETVFRAVSARIRG
jgi:ADP-heptose:LPS heptosyltransferase